MKRKQLTCPAAVISFFVLFVFCTVALPLSGALKCFHCDKNCREDDMGEALTCRPGFDVCMKVKTTSRVERVCGTAEACGFGVSETWARRLYRQLSMAMGTVHKKSPWEKEENGKWSVFCCDTDFCNKAGSFTKTSPSVVVTSLLLHYLLLKLFVTCRWAS